VPFASAWALFGLSKLSVWWLRLGIRLERIKPGNPQQNGRHERTVFAGQNVGVKEVSERIWLVTFMDYDLGFFDDETCRLESAINPFEPKVLPMSPV
jgi:hypothetical protein